MTDYDLAIIGGGLNGVSVARDAAGRGLKVILLEQGDLGQSASSASPRLIHGSLGMLERRAFKRVRSALEERDIWLRAAPHLVRPLRFALPVHLDGRPPWLLRSGLWLYDQLGSKNVLPASVALDTAHHPLGDVLQRQFRVAFEYSDCVADDSRLVVLNAVDAAERGAVICTGARCVRAERLDTWRLILVDRGHRQAITAKALLNATGAWSASTAETVLRTPPTRVGTVRTSQIVVKRRFRAGHGYVFENSDRRLIFVTPYERDYTLIGTAVRTFEGDPAVVTMDAGDIDYLCDAVNRYFREPVDPVDVVRTICGANTDFDDTGMGSARDGALLFDQRRGDAPLLTMFGGDMTTSRLRAEQAVSRLVAICPMAPHWTAAASLPGGDFAWTQRGALVDSVVERWPFLSPAQADRLVAAYGTRVEAVLGDATTRADLGPVFGSELTGTEVRYLMAKEWARFPDDILWRRSKLGLTMPAQDQEALAAFMAAAA